METVEELHSPTRQRAAKALSKMFVECTSKATKEGSFKLPTGQNEDAFGLRLGLTVEYALYMNYWGHEETPKPIYGEKLRSILHNVKNNPKLRDMLLNGSLSPHDLSNMTFLEMARQELQEQTAQILKENEKQHVLVQEEGPRIRRTHKGEEVIGDESQHASNHEAGATAARRRDSKDDSAQAASPEQMSSQSPNAVELPQDIGKSPAAASSATISNPLRVDTSHRRQSSQQLRRKSTASNFNMDNVWSSIDSPSVRNRPVPIPTTPAANTIAEYNAPPASATKADPEIDHLLKDPSGGDDDEEPYSPMEYVMEDGAIWRGRMVMPTVAEFSGSAKYVAGADLHAVFPWTQLVPPILAIEGRIPVDRASDYVCSLRWSKTTDVTVISVTPSEQDDDRKEFDKLFDYFVERDRWGVGGQSPVAAVRDVYIIPVEKGEAKKPDFLDLMENDSLENTDRKERCLLVTYVMKTRAEKGPAQVKSDIATAANGDSVPPVPGDGSDQQAATAQPFRSPSAAAAAVSNTAGGSGLSPYQSLVAPPSYTPAAPNQAEAQQTFTKQPQQTPSTAIPTPTAAATTLAQPSAQEKKGTEAAALVLGPELMAAPTVVQLLQQTQETAESQWRVIRDILIGDQRCKVDWGAFMGALQERLRRGGIA